ncbi:MULTISPECIES: class I adenylate-forming enzyme family protein [Bhargavaea]|uniref:Class I adenylate-forming enzyme family protein n=1 Tax=Bhargavaea changchunensis TaxID=2134037 RepID=A0ABW2NDH3_9BACL|nr:long-chain fatty acid--CoA ligase [Bhargavaea sp. CC-171006]
MYTDHGWIMKRAEITPDSTALIDVHTGQRWSYRELAVRTAGFVETFHSAGLRKGERVAVLSHNRIDLFAILFACAGRGLIYVPMNWRLSEGELRYIVDDSGPSLLLHDDEHAGRAAGLGVPAIPLDSVPSASVYPLSEKVACRPDDPWMMIYTGGTTGRPKGVVLTFQSVNWNALNTIVSWSLSARDRTLNYMPLFHTGGLNALSLPILMAGGTVVIGRKFDPEEAIRALNEYQTTISLFVPTMHQSMLDTDLFWETDFPTVDVFLSGGAPCPQTVYDAYRRKGERFKEGYGMTEAGPNNFVIDPDTAMKKRGAVGKSMQFNEVRIVDSKGRICRPGEVGELHLRGRHLFSHYWNNEEATREALKDGWFSTGDLATLDEDGDCFIVGRKKEMIISGGENIYPQEVEQCLIGHDGVKEIAVIGIPDRKWGERVVAFITAHPANVPKTEELLRHCAQTLGSYKIPKDFFFIQELPKTDIGKIDKKKLAKMAKELKKEEMQHPGQSG